MPEFVQVSVERIFEALSKSGFEHIRSEWFDTDVDGVIVGGCILQQGAMNLSVWSTNDDEKQNTRADEGYSLVEALDQFDVDESSRWFLSFDDHVGSTIVHWNDKVTPNGDWVLKTYGDVLQMAKDLLTPYFGESVSLQKKVWDFKRNPELIFQGAAPA